MYYVGMLTKGRQMAIGQMQGDIDGQKIFEAKKLEAHK
jgi:hypothetical protein